MFFFSSRRRHTRCGRDWSSDVCSSDLEVTPESLRQAQHALGTEMEGARAVLRFYDISLIHFDGTNAHHTFDIDIGLEARNWYVHLWTAEKSYCADLGFVARAGRFHAITRSNVVHTPRAG